MVTGIEIFWTVVIIVVGSFLAGAVETWWEQRKWQKGKGKWN